MSTPSDTRPKRQLSLFDSTCLIVGIIIGAGIYETVPQVAQGTLSAPGLFAIWAVGGFLSLCGALGYAELATAYPEEGGDYVYLKRAYGRWAGFLFGWIQLAVVRPGDIVGMAFIFGNYGSELWDPLAGIAAEGGFPWTKAGYAVAAVVVLTTIHVIGVREGKWTQNVLTTVKVLGLLAIVLVAVVGPGAAPAGEPAEVPFFPLDVALILVLFTFGGWNEMAYVAAEVRNPRRNIVRALVLGTVAVTVLYLLVNAAFLFALGYEGVANSEVVATDTVSTVFPETGARLISALICISALGAVNGLIFAGARISYAVGAEHRVFHRLGRWNSRTDTPVAALVVQGILAVILVLALGSFVDAVLYVAAPVYAFYLATSFAVFVLRRKEPGIERPYRVTGYPVPTIIFCIVCGFMIRGAVSYKPAVAGGALAILLLGLPVYWLSRHLESRGGR